MDMQWAATDELIISLAGSWLDSTYDEWDTGPCWASQEIDPSHPAYQPGCVDGFRDAEGDDTMHSPEWAFNLRFDYSVPVFESMEARAVLNVNYSDDFFTGGKLDPVITHQDDYTTVDLRLSLGEYAGGWELALLGKNLTDETYGFDADSQPLVPGNGYVSTARPRSYAIQGTYRF
jgi:outer membrane receptor protein involved in Fe transport